MSQRFNPDANPAGRPADPVILAFDTTTDYLSLALGRRCKTAASRHFSAYRDHMKKLMPAVDEVLKEAGKTLAAVDALAVGIGPGSFTGARIGVATAQGLAHGSGKPLIGISSLDILAAAVTKPEALTCPIVDAKRGEVYTAFYRNGKRLTDYLVLYPDDLALFLKDQPGEIIAFGDGLVLHGSTLKKKLGKRFKVGSEEKWFPNAENLIGLAADRLTASAPPAYYEVLPIYIRLSDAEEALKRQKQL